MSLSSNDPKPVAMGDETNSSGEAKLSMSSEQMRELFHVIDASTRFFIEANKDRLAPLLRNPNERAYYNMLELKIPGYDNPWAPYNTSLLAAKLNDYTKAIPEPTSFLVVRGKKKIARQLRKVQETMVQNPPHHTPVYPPEYPPGTPLIPIGGLEKCCCKPGCQVELCVPAYRTLSAEEEERFGIHEKPEPPPARPKICKVVIKHRPK